MQKKSKYLSRWSGNYSKAAMVYVLILSIILLAFYNISVINPVWFLITICIVSGYFMALYFLNKSWQYTTHQEFKRRLFWSSFVFRFLASFLLIAIAHLTWDQFHYVGAVDARSYHREAIEVSVYLRSFDFPGAFFSAFSNTFQIDNTGPPLLIGSIYAIFGVNYYLATVVLAFISSFGVYYLYKTASLIWGERIARTAGIMYMFFPFSLFFSVVLLKEGIIVFLVICINYILTRFIKGLKLNSKHIGALILCLTCLIFFRTAILVVCFLVVVFTFLIKTVKGEVIKPILIGSSVLLLFGSLYSFLGDQEFVMARIQSFENVGRQQLAARGLDFSLSIKNIASIILLPFALIIAVITPFPGFVEVGTRFDTGHDHNYYFIAGSVIWNILAYFSLVGIWYTIKNKFIENLPILAFTIGYLMVLILTFLITRDRFAFVAMPLLLIFASVGVYKNKNNLYFHLYLTLLIVATIIWNYLRLGARGFM